MSLVIDEDGHATADRETSGAGLLPGLYHRDDRVLAAYAWRWLLPASCTRASQREVTNDGRAWTRASEWHDESGVAQLALRRALCVEPDGVTDVVTVGNLGRERLALGVELALESIDAAAEPRVDGTSIVIASPASARPSVEVRMDALAAARPDGADWELSLAPGEELDLYCRVQLIAA